MQKYQCHQVTVAMVVVIVVKYGRYANISNWWNYEKWICKYVRTCIFTYVRTLYGGDVHLVQEEVCVCVIRACIEHRVLCVTVTVWEGVVIDTTQFVYTPLLSKKHFFVTFEQLAVFRYISWIAALIVTTLMVGVCVMCCDVVLCVHMMRFFLITN